MAKQGFLHVVLLLVFVAFAYAQQEGEGSTLKLKPEQPPWKGGGTTNPYRNGTCFTASECQSKGGTAAGNCAAGFGVCCVFLVSASGATITQNCTYIRNPGYPSTYSGTSAVSYTVNKACPGVCYLRLDFESFTIQGTSDSLETNGGVCASDTFIATVVTKTPVPTICGQNTGQHMYLDVGSGNTDSATLAFAFTGTNANRQWEIKVTQVKCGSSTTPPTGCLQYESGLTGRFTTFNFIPTTQSQLANQQYSVCIRQEVGYCCIQYTPCTDPNSFTIGSKNTIATAGKSAIDTLCDSTDYVGISGSRAFCATGAGNNGGLVSRYCGAILSSVAKATISQPICDCTQPFVVNIFTDNTNIQDATAAPADSNRGVCLTWQQIPCSQA